MAHDRENMCALCFLLLLKENSSMPVDPFQLGTVMFNSIVYLVPHCKKAGGENRHSTCLPPSPSIKEMGISALSSSFLTTLAAIHFSSVKPVAIFQPPIWADLNAQS